ncbi:MAG: TlpA family protein disulfide reductase [Gammaproteobacteria bacterium]|nr:TlpA family protein disulfide reductase [Gammaproteobacteria bacterium]MDH4255899.1 TlpA family protein disulfide reductase [Gammaproteobacteria bacterium]MDH5310403.1 TlpA family protein disulfide reductase [Gammaproteobacteria bacterium]
MHRLRFALSSRFLLLLSFCWLAEAPAGFAANTDQLDLSSYRGKVVVVDFWASWCVPCRRSFPWLNQMQAKYADQGLVIVGVNMDAEPGEAEAFLEEFPADFRIVADPGGGLAKQFDVIAMPSSYVLDGNGQVVARHLGFKVKKQDEYEAAIQDALSQLEGN